MAAPDMNTQNPAEEGAEAPQAGSPPAAGPQDKGKDPVQVLMGIQTALTELGKGLAGSIPKEADAALQGAITQYNTFLSIVGKNMGVQGMPAPQGGAKPPMGGNMSADARPGATPAGMPTRPGISPA